MKRRALVLFLFSFLAVAGSETIRAADVSQVLEGFLTVELANTGHQAHFTQSDIVLTFNAAVASQFTTYPLGSSSGGLTYTFDPSLGAATRSSNTFGSPFRERALTLGKKKWNAGFRFLHATSDSIDGLDLSDGSIVVQLQHLDEGLPGRTNPGEEFEGDLIQTRFTAELTLDTALLFATYGVTDRIDIGVVLPVVKAKLDASAAQEILRLSTGTADNTTHNFCLPPGDCTVRTLSDSESATGIGDVVLRGKYDFYRVEHLGLGTGLDVRLPTGREEDFLGTGVTQYRVYFIGSGLYAKFSPHLNLGYTFSSGTSAVAGDLSDEINYLAGFDAALHPRVTLAVDLIGRNLRDARRFEERQTAFAHVPSPGALGTPPSPTTLLQLTPFRDDANILQGGLGLKFNPSGGFLISAGALFPLNDDGLKSDVSGFVGLDWTF